ncbi:hypothetical protein BZA05DRAFT_393655 [Tricharina praecox]|uniref:uncharacterized protein n=1 Tax=Tricharina praecox TaxID=43433 RepID=UPI002220E1EB|nr:uncharacterized protein BZA05DRAFT_393655 [Tricharina praecox]KAI5854248.1 hypothetical protein BZA05DRAFT_393655 [Tricharina praecox]
MTEPSTSPTCSPSLSESSESPTDTWTAERSEAGETDTTATSSSSSLTEVCTAEYSEAGETDAAASFTCTCCLQELPANEQTRSALCHNPEHLWCNSCHHRMFTNAQSDESQYPPRCCSPSHAVDSEPLHFSELERNKWQQRRAEMSVPPEKRVYCADLKGCGLFVGERRGRLSARFPIALRCSDCGTKTCAVCTGKAHSRLLCVRHNTQQTEQSLEELAKRNHWRRCPYCKVLVIRAGGCATMFCRCGYNWCYKCGKGPCTSCKCIRW